MDPHDLLVVPARRWRVLIACVLMSVGAGLVTLPTKATTKSSPVVYKATAVVGSPKGSNVADSTQFASVIKSDAIIHAAGAQLQLSGSRVKALSDSVHVLSDPTQGTISITATGLAPVATADAANAVTSQFLTYLDQNNKTAYQDQLTSAQHRVDGLREHIDLIKRDTTHGANLAAELDTLNLQFSTAFVKLSNLQLAGPPKPNFTKLNDAVAVVAPPAAPLYFVAKKGGGFHLPKSRSSWMALVVGMGLILGLIMTFVVDWLDTRFWTRGDVERSLGLPVVAEVPALPKSRRTKRHVVTAEPRSRVASGYRGLRAALLSAPRRVLTLDWVPDHAGDGAAAGPRASAGEDASSSGVTMGPATDPDVSGEVRVVMVTSPSNGEGRTSTVVNLATCLAEVGKRVLVLGLDFNHRDLASWLAVRSEPGLATWLQRTDGLTIEEFVQPSGIPNVRVLPCGAGITNPTLYLPRIRTLLQEARGLADVVILDTAPGLITYDALDLAPEVDSVVLVVRAGRTRAVSASRLLGQLANIGSPMLGVALIGTRPRVRFPARSRLRGRRVRHGRRVRPSPSHAGRRPPGKIASPQDKSPVDQTDSGNQNALARIEDSSGPAHEGRATPSAPATVVSPGASPKPASDDSEHPTDVTGQVAWSDGEISPPVENGGGYWATKANAAP